MSRLARILSAVVLASTLLTMGAGAVAAHNAGCVLTGNGEYTFVGSNKESPTVPEQNPSSSYDSRTDRIVLDLQPETPGSDQYGARYAADQGHSAVERPVTTDTDPRDCEPPGPRADN
jgi:hypothetical protein